MPRRCAAVLVSLALASPLLLLSGPASAAPTPAKPYDVNGDGFPEQVVGAPDLQVGSVAVAVIKSTTVVVERAPAPKGRTSP